MTREGLVMTVSLKLVVVGLSLVGVGHGDRVSGMAIGELEFK